MKLTKTDWLERGLAVLAQYGPEHLKIDRLCAHLKVTKGSFYHYFASRDDYTDTLLSYWQQRNTQDIIAAVDAVSDLPSRSRTLAAITQNMDTSPENAIRAWARYQPNVAERLAQVDQERMDYLTELIKPQLNQPAQASTVAKLVYAHLIGVQQLGELVSAEEWRNMDDLLQAVFIGQPVKEGL
ncbi:TetR/AcrR family transcriptional regulator [Marinimicrobium sp. ABcell2]|uniref:TetR/AcrR family transcriptional regulator n=1 Tax=Marinimicrobium sp. ABcell2 TaxID=3069751 RepID=UPI0027B5EE75|nr:TetR/AcrR family transcriptional regulator [Marinimicrobium sp. ABcell2]MDQ2078380.1 TetR/AcrR family transcriptional regulator [Marinimicrobium sp. ABcell2]